MNIKDYKYLVSIAEDKNIRKTAEKFFITPSALTQKIKLIENEIGAELFVRSNSGCVPTENGEIFIEAAKQILLVDDTMRKRIQDNKTASIGELKIGLPPDRGADMFMYIYPLFHETYPSINITLIESGTRHLQKYIRDGKIDLAIVGALESQQTKDNYISIRREEMLVLMPQSYVASGMSVDADCFDLNQLKDCPFALVGKESTMREWQEQIFSSYDFLPKIAFETAKVSTILKMVSMGLCCSIVSDYYYDPALENVVFSHLAGRPSWNISALYNINGYLTKPVRYFIELAKNFSDEVPRLK